MKYYNPTKLSHRHALFVLLVGDPKMTYLYFHYHAYSVYAFLIAENELFGEVIWLVRRQWRAEHIAMTYEPWSSIRLTPQQRETIELTMHYYRFMLDVDYARLYKRLQQVTYDLAIKYDVLMDHGEIMEFVLFNHYLDRRPNQSIQPEKMKWHWKLDDWRPWSVRPFPNIPCETRRDFIRLNDYYAEIYGT